LRAVETANGHLEGDYAMKNIAIATVLTATTALMLGAQSYSALTEQQHKNIDDVREVVKQAARKNIEITTRRTLKRRLKITSRDRTGSLKSAAHDRGAIDISSKALNQASRQREAAQISRALGPNHTVVVEKRIE
jgi:hypothetical protein